MYSFKEARRIARGHGFESREEFIEYSCPGAYKLPKDPDKVWSDEWKGWDDFLGIPYQNFEHARKIAQRLRLESQEEWMQLFEDSKFNDDDPAIRLPYRPDLYYKKEWRGWDEWLNGGNG